MIFVGAHTTGTCDNKQCTSLFPITLWEVSQYGFIRPSTKNKHVFCQSIWQIGETASCFLLKNACKFSKFNPWKCMGMKVHGYEKDQGWKWTGMKRPGFLVTSVKFVSGSHGRPVSVTELSNPE